MWLRKFEDFMDTQEGRDKDGKRVPLSGKEKVGLLKYYTDGFPRDLIEQVEIKDKDDYDVVKNYLLKAMESPKSLDLARQILRSTMHLPHESVDDFANKLSPLVRAACADESEATKMKRTMEEFVDKIRYPIGLLMSGQVYNSFEEARMIAKSVEAQLAKRRNVGVEESVGELPFP
jgi:hypothetical protein